MCAGRFARRRGLFVGADDIAVDRFSVEFPHFVVVLVAAAAVGRCGFGAELRRFSRTLFGGGCDE